MAQGEAVAQLVSAVWLRINVAGSILGFKASFASAPTSSCSTCLRCGSELTTFVGFPCSSLIQCEAVCLMARSVGHVKLLGSLGWH